MRLVSIQVQIFKISYNLNSLHANALGGPTIKKQSS